jgi:hypothetical protein
MPTYVGQALFGVDEPDEMEGAPAEVFAVVLVLPPCRRYLLEDCPRVSCCRR